LDKKYTLTYGATISTGGRTGNRLVIGADANAIKTLDAQSTWIVGFAYKWSGDGWSSMCQLSDVSSAQIALRVNADGSISVCRGIAQSGTVIGTSSLAISENIWHYIEWKSTINNSTGTSEVRIDNISVLSLTAQDTQSTANATANSIKFGADYSKAADYDDLVICDGAGGSFDDFVGDVTIKACMPDADSATVDWTPSTGSDHYALVDEVPPSATDYVSSGTADQIDEYSFANTGYTSATVKAVVVSVVASKSDAGVRTMAIMAHSGATDSAGDEISPSTSALYYQRMLTTDPNTSAAWSLSAAETAEFGVKVVS